jgi:formate dehydrogenase iron-sulfur subunit
MSSWAILTDVTRCIGCEECVTACQASNGTGTDAPRAWQQDPADLSSTRWTTIVRSSQGRSVRLHCRHCLEPACASACPVGALRRTPEGPVAYDASICMGCRYCMIACPFRMTRYEWESATPRVRKCILCYERVKSGELTEPACTKACPTQATIFGDRDELLRIARERIRTNPERYIDHVWGEHEVGGTSVLYISDVDLGAAGWPEYLRDASYPALTRTAMHAVPPTFLTVGAAMFGLSWVIGRRRKLASGGEPADTAEDRPGRDGEVEP